MSRISPIRLGIPLKYQMWETGAARAIWPIRSRRTLDLVTSTPQDVYKRQKMLSVAFTGVDHIAMDACKANGVLVSNCAGYSTAAVADLVFGMIIALYRNMIPCNDVVRKEGTKDGLVGFELEGKKFGVIGTGAIGLRTAAIANAFGCQVLAYSRTKKDIPGITYVEDVYKRQVLRDSVSPSFTEGSMGDLSGYPASCMVLPPASSSII